MSRQHYKTKDATNSSQEFAASSSNVELVGFEPTSKQGNHTLSTRLFQPLVFVRRQDLDHQPAP